VPADSPQVFASVEVIRPAALLSEAATRLILAGLESDDVRAGGRWHARPGIWQRYESPSRCSGSR
jgi:hypothetical protein